MNPICVITLFVLETVAQLPRTSPNVLLLQTLAPLPSHVIPPLEIVKNLELSLVLLMKMDVLLFVPLELVFLSFLLVEPQHLLLLQHLLQHQNQNQPQPQHLELLQPLSQPQLQLQNQPLPQLLELLQHLLQFLLPLELVMPLVRMMLVPSEPVFQLESVLKNQEIVKPLPLIMELALTPPTVLLP